MNENDLELHHQLKRLESELDTVKGDLGMVFRKIDDIYQKITNLSFKIKLGEQYEPTK